MSKYPYMDICARQLKATRHMVPLRYHPSLAQWNVLIYLGFVNGLLYSFHMSTCAPPVYPCRPVDCLLREEGPTHE